MKESISVRSLPEYNVDLEIINEIVRIINSIRPWRIIRPYLFSKKLTSYSIQECAIHSEKIYFLVEEINKKILSNEFLKDKRLIESGLGIYTGDYFEIKESINHLLLDTVTRNIHIPLLGESTFDNISLEIGVPYILDNKTGYKFTCTGDVMHLVFNYIDLNDDRYIWNLWKLG